MVVPERSGYVPVPLATVRLVQEEIANRRFGERFARHDRRLTPQFSASPIGTG